MKKFIKQEIIKIFFKIIEKLMDDSQVVEVDPEFEKMVDNLVDGVGTGPSNDVNTPDACDKNYCQWNMDGICQFKQPCHEFERR